MQQRRVGNSGLVVSRLGLGTWLWGEDTAVDQTFDDVLALAARCRFSNCQHEEEPGCAVHAAVEEGTLSVDRLIGYMKLREERAFLQREVNPALRRERRNEERLLTKEAWLRSRSKRGELGAGRALSPCACAGSGTPRWRGGPRGGRAAGAPRAERPCPGR